MKMAANKCSNWSKANLNIIGQDLVKALWEQLLAGILPSSTFLPPTILHTTEVQEEEEKTEQREGRKQTATHFSNNNLYHCATSKHTQSQFPFSTNIVP